MKLIDKDALVAEIESLTDNSKYCDAYECGFRDGNNSAIDSLKGKLNTLEVKDVDLEKEIDKFYGMYRDKNGVTHDMQDNEICLDWKEDCNYHFKIEFAKHFFELGLKAKQE